MDKAKQYGVDSVSALVVDGKILKCCKLGRPTKASGRRDAAGKLEAHGPFLREPKEGKKLHLQLFILPKRTPLSITGRNRRFPQFKMSISKFDPNRPLLINVMKPVSHKEHHELLLCTAIMIRTDDKFHALRAAGGQSPWKNFQMRACIT